jgi:branched-chain amino acid transport system ATP-binding protein
VRPGEIHALIGPNGAGKTTLVEPAHRQPAPDTGTIHFAGRDITACPCTARVRLGWRAPSRSPRMLREFTALDNVAATASSASSRSPWRWRPTRALLLDEPMAGMGPRNRSA